jgi:glycosyltransferase involved in cell wall biosynthesis
MRCGCPVIVSDIPTFVEVVGNAGIRVDLENPDALVQALEDVLSKSIRATLVKKGLVQSKNFRWHAMAETIRSLL